MKILQYKLCASDSEGLEVFYNKLLGWSSENEATAIKEAYNGEYQIIEVEDEDNIPMIERLEAQVTYTAMMTDTLLEEV